LDLSVLEYETNTFSRNVGNQVLASSQSDDVTQNSQQFCAGHRPSQMRGFGGLSQHLQANSELLHE